MIQNKKRVIPNFIISLIIVAGIRWVCAKFVHLGNVEFTDNAQVKQHLSPVSTRVQGFIKKICFEEYQQVRKGDTLVIIEDTEYRLKLAQAIADYYSPECDSIRKFLGLLSGHLYRGAGEYPAFGTGDDTDKRLGELALYALVCNRNAGVCVALCIFPDQACPDAAENASLRN